MYLRATYNNKDNISNKEIEAITSINTKRFYRYERELVLLNIIRYLSYTNKTISTFQLKYIKEALYDCY